MSHQLSAGHGRIKTAGSSKKPVKFSSSPAFESCQSFGYSMGHGRCFYRSHKPFYEPDLVAPGLSTWLVSSSLSGHVKSDADIVEDEDDTDHDDDKNNDKRETLAE